ncbi:TPA: hexitol phosphatase HxpB [Candidatus Uhrbacteria bacterium]|nr:hexitol phosphatase HxpB [Candidatus Uhrbacteria bacterium]
MIEAVIFDMDGLLIDSEPLWQEAQITSFKRVGILLDRKMCLETMGLRVDDVVDHWNDTFPGNIQDKDSVIRDILSGVISLVIEKGRPREGVYEILKFIKSKHVKTAIASSSQLTLIKTVVQKLGIEAYFDELYSAEMEEYGKPHPGVYITTASTLDVAPEKCLALEDSFNGLLSAKAARMQCVCVPDESIRQNPRIILADLVLDSLADFNQEHWNRLNK